MLRYGQQHSFQILEETGERAFHCSIINPWPEVKIRQECGTLCIMLMVYDSLDAKLECLKQSLPAGPSYC